MLIFDVFIGLGLVFIVCSLSFIVFGCFLSVLFLPFVLQTSDHLFFVALARRAFSGCLLPSNSLGGLPRAWSLRALKSLGYGKNKRPRFFYFLIPEWLNDQKV